MYSWALLEVAFRAQEIEERRALNEEKRMLADLLSSDFSLVLCCAALKAVSF